MIILKGPYSQPIDYDVYAFQNAFRIYEINATDDNLKIVCYSNAEKKLYIEKYIENCWQNLVFYYWNL